MSGQLVYPKYMRQQYPQRFLLEKGLPSVSIKVQSPPNFDYFDLISCRPEMSSSRRSRFASLRELAKYRRQPKPERNAAIPRTPILLYPSQDFPQVPSSSSLEVFISFCYCIIHAYYLFFGQYLLGYEKPAYIFLVRREQQLLAREFAGLWRMRCLSVELETIFLIIINLNQVYNCSGKHQKYQK